MIAHRCQITLNPTATRSIVKTLYLSRFLIVVTAVETGGQEELKQLLTPEQMEKYRRRELIPNS